MMKTIVLAGAVLAFAGSALAQDNEQRDRQMAEMKAAMERGMVAARVPLETITTGAPYSAQTVTETTQTLGDGNRISRRTTGRIYRDGAGRVRREEDRQDGTIAISIVDPVAGAAYRLDPETRIAWKTPANAVAALMKTAVILEKQRAELEQRAAAARSGVPAEAGGGNVVVAARGRSEMEKETAGPLEHRTIGGIAVEGRSVTRTIPAGEIGNERPITILNEEWSSPDLKVLVMTHHNDPRTGESSYQLTNVVRGEPDATLFAVPPGYELRESGVRREQR